jgi:ABC-type sugar transport systems, ATPase components
VRLPFGIVPLAPAVAERVAGRRLLIAGIRPEHFEDATRLDPEARTRGVSFTALVDVTEWLGAEQFAYIPYEAPPEITDQLRDLARELDSESLRTQLVVALDPDSRICRGEEAQLWFDPARMHLFAVSGECLTRELDPAVVP